MAFTISSEPMCRLFTALSKPPPIRLRFREPPALLFSQRGHSNFVWFGISLDVCKRCARARAGMAVTAEYENVALGA